MGLYQRTINKSQRLENNLQILNLLIKKLKGDSLIDNFRKIFLYKFVRKKELLIIRLIIILI